MPEVKPGELHRSISAAEQTKLIDRQRWSLSLLYLENRQHLRWDRNVQRYMVESPQSSERRVTINHILPIYRNVVARFQANYPGTVAIPASPSTEDIVKATMTNLAVRNHWLTVRIPTVIAGLVRFLATCGTSALHTFYDPIKDTVMTAHVDPYNLFAEGGSEEWEESDTISIRTYVTPAELKKFVGIDGAPKTLTDDVIDNMVQVDPSDARMFGKPYSSYTSERKRIELYETYWRDGTRALWTQGQVVWQGENKIKDIPIRIVRYTPVPKRLWGVSLIYPLIELQWLYNQGRAQIQQNIEHMSNPKWLIPKNAGIPRSAITNRTGEKIYYNGASREPKQISMAPIPGYVVENIARIQSEMQDVAGTHSVSLGKRSVGVHSGEAIRALSARDSSQLQLTQEEIVTAVELAGNDAARLMKIHYPESKWMRMLDSMGETVYHELKRTDLQDDPEVYIEASTLFRDEAQDRDQRTMDELNANLITPEEAKRRLSTHIDTTWIRYAADMSHAHDILRALVDNPDYTVEIYRTDNLKAFKEVFEEFIGNDSFDALAPENQDYIRDVFVAIISAGDPAKMAAMQADPRVWPPQPIDKAPPKEIAEGFTAPQSGMAEQQAAEAAMQMALEKQEAAVAKGLLDEEPAQGLATAGPGGQRLGALGGDF